MPYLIDGHNLIGKGAGGLSLNDPDDEVKLVQLIKQLCMRENRRATIVFDRGLPGGRSSMSNQDVEVYFAPSKSSADEVLLNRIYKEKNPKGLIVVTSDNAVATAARRRGMKVTPADEFAAKFGNRRGAGSPEKPDGLTEDELKDWEALFQKKRPPR